jgi:HK97 family phage major capsid protein
MAGYANIIGRADVGDAIISPQVSNEIIKATPEQSVVLSNARRVTLSTKVHKQPVLNQLPVAFWVDGDTGIKQTDKAVWGSVTITAEELAVIVPVPNAVIDDANVPLWDQVRPLIVEALGKAVDEAALFGTAKPSSWPQGIVPAAIAKGNAVELGSGPDMAADVAALGGLIAAQGFGVSAFASEPGLQWRLIGLRSTDGVPIYTPSLSASAPSGLYGMPLTEVRNGSWRSDVAHLLAVDWSKFVIGVRQDITYDIFSEGVISDQDGKVVLNLIQQDAKALRVVFRVGFQAANPVNRLQADGYAAGVIIPAEE